MVYICPHTAMRLIFDHFYLPKYLICWSSYPSENKVVTFPKCYQNFQPWKVIMESLELSSQTPNCMLTGDRTMILEGRANF